MSFQYDQYLARHRANVKRGFDWLSKNLPGLMTNTLTAGWNTEFAHDQSKNELGTMVILGDLDNCYRTMRIWFLLYR